MKKTLVIVSLSIVLTVILVSCRIGLNSQKSVAKYEQATSREVQGLGVVQIPLIVDLDIRIDPTDPSRSRMTHDYTQNIVSKELRQLREELLGGRYKAKEVDQKQYQLQQIDKYMEDKALSMVYAFKQMAKSEMLIIYNADVLIDPRYSIEIINNETVKVTVSGYLGTYKNFRSIQPKDTALFKVNPIITSPDYEMGGIKIIN